MKINSFILSFLLLAVFFSRNSDAQLHCLKFDEGSDCRALCQQKFADDGSIVYRCEPSDGNGPITLCWTKFGTIFPTCCPNCRIVMGVRAPEVVCDDNCYNPIELPIAFNTRAARCRTILIRPMLRCRLITNRPCNPKSNCWQPICGRVRCN